MMAEPAPDQCEHPDCEEPPLVGLNSHYVCKAHIQWAFETHIPKPRDLLERLEKTDGP